MSRSAPNSIPPSYPDTSQLETNYTTLSPLKGSNPTQTACIISSLPFVYCHFISYHTVTSGGRPRFPRPKHAGTGWVPELRLQSSCISTGKQILSLPRAGRKHPCLPFSVWGPGCFLFG
jgi:hypothetical protein